MATRKVECEFCHQMVYVSDYHSNCSQCGARLRVPGGAKTQRASLGESTADGPKTNLADRTQRGLRPTDTVPPPGVDFDEEPEVGPERGGARSLGESQPAMDDEATWDFTPGQSADRPVVPPPRLSETSVEEVDQEEYAEPIEVPEEVESPEPSDDWGGASVPGPEDDTGKTGVSLPPPSLRAVLLVDRGERGWERHPMREPEAILGRIDGFPRELNIPVDSLLSPAHARFHYAGGKLVIRDDDSLNGIYLKVPGQAPLEDGQRILMGSLVFRFELLPPAEEEPEPGEEAGTVPMGAGAEVPRAQLVAINEGGRDGLTYQLSGEKTVLGRQSGAYTFAGDRLLSGRHAQFEMVDGHFEIENLSQANGTFIQIRERALEEGDILRIGAQIVRVEYE